MVFFFQIWQFLKSWLKIYVRLRSFKNIMCLLYSSKINLIRGGYFPHNWYKYEILFWPTIFLFYVNSTRKASRKIISRRDLETFLRKFKRGSSRKKRVRRLSRNPDRHAVGKQSHPPRPTQTLPVNPGTYLVTKRSDHSGWPMAEV